MRTQTARDYLLKIQTICEAPYFAQDIAARRERIRELAKEGYKCVRHTLWYRQHGDHVRIWSESLREYGRFEIMTKAEFLVFKDLGEKVDVQFIQMNPDDDEET